MNTCSTCDYSRDEQGNLFVNANRAFCVGPIAEQNSPCELQRNHPADEHTCGVEGIFWKARE